MMQKRINNTKSLKIRHLIKLSKSYVNPNMFYTCIVKHVMGKKLR